MSLRDNDHAYQAVYRSSADLSRNRGWPFGGVESNGIVASFVRFQYSSWPLTHPFPILPPTDPFHSCPKLSNSLLLWMARNPPPVSAIHLWGMLCYFGGNQLQRKLLWQPLGHLGVCVLCSNCFISAEKKKYLLTMFLQLTVASVERIRLIKE